MWLLYRQKTLQTNQQVNTSASSCARIGHGELSDVNSCVLRWEEQDQVQDQTCVISQTTTLCDLLQTNTVVCE